MIFLELCSAQPKWQYMSTLCLSPNVELRTDEIKYGNHTRPWKGFGTR